MCSALEQQSHQLVKAAQPSVVVLLLLLLLLLLDCFAQVLSPLASRSHVTVLLLLQRCLAIPKTAADLLCTACSEHCGCCSLYHQYAVESLGVDQSLLCVTAICM